MFSPLWNMQIRIVKDLVNPIVLDPSAVTLHLEAAIFSGDPFTGFSTDETRFGLEAPAKYKGGH